VKKVVQLSADLPSVCRLGLATRGNTHLETSAVEYAIERGVNYLNWCGKPDGMSRAIAGLGARRKDAVVAVQFQARGAEKAKREFDWLLNQLATDYIDIATLYYVEAEDEWREIIAPGGAWKALAERKRAGALRMIGLTSHQRKLAAAWAALRAPGHEAGRYLDMLMIRYNAAHRGAEEDVFPLTAKLGTPVVTFTGLRWRALPRSTPEDPPGFSPPSAAEFYRFCLSNPAVSVALTAPDNRAELEESLTLLDDWRALTAQEDKALRDHGDRVRQNAGEFW
jgi:aryl-alcohol dehydrogenase-like predicted oxidoreductase